VWSIVQKNSNSDPLITAFLSFLSLEMYSFTVTHNKESIAVSVGPTIKRRRELTVSLSGDPYSRVIIYDLKILKIRHIHDSKDGEFKMTFGGPEIELRWGIAGPEGVIEDRIIILNPAKGNFTLETSKGWPHRELAMPINHNFASNPAPSFKLYKYKGEMKAKLL